MSPLLSRLVVVSLIWTFACTAIAETRISDKLVHFKLDNGMTVFIYPRHNAPLFAAMLIVDAGSAEEQVGQTGLAHLLEHMAFKGTPWVGTRNWEKERPILIEIEKTGQALNRARQAFTPDPAEIVKLQEKLMELQAQAAEYTIPNEYDNIITRAGGQEVNATTSVDYTNYFMTLPANKLEMWAMMESQRMLYPSWREFYQERDVVAEERRMRTDDSPGGKLYETLLAAAFNAHPYRNPTIGWMPDIQSLTITETDEFYKAWYVPENMVAIFVGDVKEAEARPILEQYFGAIPARTSPPKAFTVEPEQDGERRFDVMFDSQPELVIGWHKPTFPNPDMYVIEVIQYVLTRSGRSSRLYERLIKQENACSSVESFTAPGDKYPNLFAVWATPRAPHTSAFVEKVVLEEIERLKNEPVSEEELEKIRNQIDSDFLKELETNLGFARKLGAYYLSSRNPDIIDDLRDKMKATTAQDIQRVARKYFTKENRTVGNIVTRKPASLPNGPVAAADASTSAPEAKQ